VRFVTRPVPSFCPRCWTNRGSEWRPRKTGSGKSGKGIAKILKSYGAHIIITEIRNIASLEAVFDGYEVMKIDEAAAIGDIFCTITGNNADYGGGGISNNQSSPFITN
jgi:hypothetical protein